MNSGSSNNKILGNTITNSINNAILLNNGSSGNTFSSNKIVSSTPQGLKIKQDPTSKNNIFSDNQIIRLSAGIPAGSETASSQGPSTKQIVPHHNSSNK